MSIDTTVRLESAQETPPCSIGVSGDHIVVVGARDRANGKRRDETREGHRRREIRTFFVLFFYRRDKNPNKRELFFFLLVRNKRNPKKLAKCWLQNNFSAIVVIFVFPLNEIIS